MLRRPRGEQPRRERAEEGPAEAAAQERARARPPTDSLPQARVVVAHVPRAHFYRHKLGPAAPRLQLRPRVQRRVLLPQPLKLIGQSQPQPAPYRRRHHIQLQPAQAGDGPKLVAPRLARAVHRGRLRSVGVIEASCRSKAARNDAWQRERLGPLFQWLPIRASLLHNPRKRIQVQSPTTINVSLQHKRRHLFRSYGNSKLVQCTLSC